MSMHMDLFICPHCKCTLFLRIKCVAYSGWIIYQCTCRYDVAISEAFKEIVFILRIVENVKYFFWILCDGFLQYFPMPFPNLLDIFTQFIFYPLQYHLLQSVKSPA